MSALNKKEINKSLRRQQKKRDIPEKISIVCNANNIQIIQCDSQEAKRQSQGYLLPETQTGFSKKEKNNQRGRRIEEAQIQRLANFIYQNLQKISDVPERKRNFFSSSNSFDEVKIVYNQFNKVEKYGSKTKKLQKQVEINKCNLNEEKQMDQQYKLFSKINNSNKNQRKNTYQLVQRLSQIQNLEELMRIKQIQQIVNQVIEISQKFENYQKLKSCNIQNTLNSRSIMKKEKTKSDNRKQAMDNFLHHYYHFLGDESLYLISKIIQINKFSYYKELNMKLFKRKNSTRRTKHKRLSNIFKESQPQKCQNDSQNELVQSSPNNKTIKTMQNQSNSILRSEPQSLLMDSIENYRFQNFSSYRWIFQQQMSSQSLMRN